MCKQNSANAALKAIHCGQKSDIGEKVTLKEAVRAEQETIRWSCESIALKPEEVGPGESFEVFVLHACLS